MEPPLTPELIGILPVGATVIGLMLTFRREARADNQALRAEFHAALADLRNDMQSLTERMSRLEGVIQGLFASRDRRNNAA